MRKSKLTPEQILQALLQAEAGTVGGEICRKLGVTEATFYRWKKTYAGLDLGELRELRQLCEENRHLKGVVADLTLDKTILRDALGKNGEPSRATRGRGPSGGLGARSLPRERASSARWSAISRTGAMIGRCGRGCVSWRTLDRRLASSACTC